MNSHNDKKCNGKQSGTNQNGTKQSSSQPGSRPQINNPLHGKTLEYIVNSLVELYGWDELARRIDIRCFKNDPSVKSSLKFLRKSDWARKMVEDLYLSSQERR